MSSLGARLVSDGCRPQPSMQRANWRRRPAPFPAMSKAVPWSGLVRTMGSPAVKVHPFSKGQTLEGNEALVVVHREHTIELSCSLPVPKKPSAPKGPWTISPCSCKARTAGKMMVFSSSPIRPLSPGMRIEPHDSNARGSDAKVPARGFRARAGPCAQWRLCSAQLATSLMGTWPVTTPTRKASVARIIKTSLTPAMSARYSVCPGNLNLPPWMVSLLMGAVTKTSTLLAAKSLTAASKLSRANSQHLDGVGPNQVG